MLTLRGKGKVLRGSEVAPPRIIRLSTDPNRPMPLRRSEGFISRDGSMPDGFAWQVVVGGAASIPSSSGPSSAISLPSAFDYLADGDIVQIGIEKGEIAVLFQKDAQQHTFLLTERCNHYCL